MADGQWATAVYSVTSTTVWADYSHTTWQALGAPDTFVQGDAVTAWSPQMQNDGEQAITFGYSTAVHATGFLIRENSGNGFVKKVEFLDENDEYHLAWQSSDQDKDLSPTSTVVDFVRFVESTPYLVKGIRVHVDTDHNLAEYEEIDAIRLFGIPPPNPGAPLAAAFPVVALPKVNGEPTNITFNNADGFNIGNNWQDTSLKGAMTGGSLNANKLTAAMLKGLTAKELKDLLDYFSTAGVVNATVQRHNAEPWTGNDKALKFILGKVWSLGDQELIARAFAASPKAAAEVFPVTGVRILLTTEGLDTTKKQLEGQSPLDRDNATFFATIINQILLKGEGAEDGDGPQQEIAQAGALTAILSNPFGNGRTVVTTDRLRNLWVNANQALAATLDERAIAQRAGERLEAVAVPTLPADTRTRPAYVSKARDAKIPKPQALIPDRVITMTVSRYTGGAVFLPKLETLNFRDSVFIDVKAWSGRLSKSSEDYQSLGFIDVLATSSEAKKEGVPPMLVYVTPVDTIIGRSVIAEATARGVLLYQAFVFETPAATAAGKPNFDIGFSIPLNYPAVMLQYQRVGNMSSITSGVIIPPLTFPLPAFRYP